MANAKGCDGVQITHSTKFGIKYAEFGKDFDPLQPDLQYISDNHRFLRHYIKLSDRVQPNQEYIEHKRQRFYEIKKSYNTMITPMCAIGNRGMYVTADGMLQACSWTGYPHHVIPTDRKSLSYQDSFYAKHRQRFNLRERSLEDVMQDPLWEKLFGSFNDPCKAWVECEQKCHADIVDENYAVGWLTN